MKRTLFASAIAVAMLWITVSFAQNPLTEQFTTLSEQIIQQAERPFDKLEELKALFTSCAEKNSSSEVKAACAEWLASSYPKIKDATPQQIYVELGSGDVKVKKIGEKAFNPPAWWFIGKPKGIRYEVSIPKYHFVLQFPLVDEGNILKQEKALKEWEWSHSGVIVIPDPWLAVEKWTTDPIEKYIIFSNPQLTGEMTEMTAGKIYKKVYENIYLLNSLKAYEEAFSKVFLQEEFPQTLEQKENYRKYLDFILKEKALPKLSGTNNLYGRENPLPINRYSLDYERLHKKYAMKYGRHPKFTNISQRQKEKWGQENYEAHIFWNKKTPEIMRVNLKPSTWGGNGKFVSK